MPPNAQMGRVMKSRRSTKAVDLHCRRLVQQPPRVDVTTRQTPQRVQDRYGQRSARAEPRFARKIHPEVHVDRATVETRQQQGLAKQVVAQLPTRVRAFVAVLVADVETAIEIVLDRHVHVLVDRGTDRLATEACGVRREVAQSTRERNAQRRLGHDHVAVLHPSTRTSGNP